MPFDDDVVFNFTWGSLVTKSNHPPATVNWYIMLINSMFISINWMIGVFCRNYVFELLCDVILPIFPMKENISKRLLSYKYLTGIDSIGSLVSVSIVTTRTLHTNCKTQAANLYHLYDIIYIIKIPNNLVSNGHVSHLINFFY